MTYPLIKIPLSFFDGTKQQDLHELKPKHWGVVKGIAQGRGGTPEWCKSVILLSLTGQAEEMASEIKEESLDGNGDWEEMLAAVRNIFTPEAYTEMSRVSFRYIQLLDSRNCTL